MKCTRHLTETLKVKAQGFDPVYVHLLHEGGKPVKLRISSPGKYSDQSLGILLDAISDAATVLLHPDANP